MGAQQIYDGKARDGMFDRAIASAREGFDVVIICHNRMQGSVLARDLMLRLPPAERVASGRFRQIVIGSGRVRVFSVFQSPSVFMGLSQAVVYVDHSVYCDPVVGDRLQALLDVLEPALARKGGA